MLIRITYTWSPQLLPQMYDACSQKNARVVCGSLCSYRHPSPRGAWAVRPVRPFPSPLQTLGTLEPLGSLGPIAHLVMPHDPVALAQTPYRISYNVGFPSGTHGVRGASRWTKGFAKMATLTSDDSQMTSNAHHMKSRGRPQSDRKRPEKIPWGSPEATKGISSRPNDETQLSIDRQCYRYRIHMYSCRSAQQRKLRV